MIFDLTKGYVPEVYSDSRDYRVFLRLASILLSVLKDNIDNVPSLYSAEDCPKDMLILLASLVGYEYDESRSIESNRMIIKYFPLLKRYRGSRTGIKIATALSLNSEEGSPTCSLDDIIIDYDYERGVLKIYYPSSSEISWDLIEEVRPAGSGLEMTPSFISKSTDEVDVKVDVFRDVETWTESRTQVEKSKVGFGDVGNTNEGGEFNE